MRKFRATVTLVWEFEAENSVDPKEVARDQMTRLIPEGMRCSVKVDRLKEPSRKIVLGEFDPEEVLPFITKDETRKTYTANGKTYSVRMNSHRYFIFQASQKCAACGLPGVKMVLEQHPNDKSPHFNLYAKENGKLVLMTKDHIQARSSGGEDRHSNYQTMCAICNNLKGNDDLTLEAIFQLRQIYNEKWEKLSRKKLNTLLRDERSKLGGKGRRLSQGKRSKRSSASKAKESVVTKCDLAIMEDDNGNLKAMSVYESADQIPQMKQIACIGKGTEITPIRSESNRVILPFNDKEFSVFHGHLAYADSSS